MIAVPNPATHDQGARQVHRLRMRIPDSAMRLRVESMVEEALRLTTLPGEDQGRVYFFRRLQLPALDFRISSQQWVARCSQHLLAASHTAQYACDAGSAFAASVYFRNQHEPRNRLLARLLAGENPQEWYWPDATGVACDLPPGLRVEQILELWHVQPAAWAAVARELLPLFEVKAARNLLELIRPITAERWLDALKSAGGEIPHGSPLPPLRAHARELLDEVCLHFPDNDPRVLFFAVLAVLESCPAVAQDATLLALAALLLRQPHASVSPVRDIRGRLLLRPKSKADLIRVSEKYTWPEQRSKSNTETANITSTKTAQRNEAETGVSAVGTSQTEQRTAFAGLYFLLHPLRHLEIAKVLEANAQLALTHFVSRILLRLALIAGVEEEDSILLPLLEDLAEQRQQPDDPLVVPATLASLQRLRPSAQLTERLWAVAVRRWCRQNARTSLRQIVVRPGRIYTTPISIDVTLPMSAVDLRIRRCGLDLDPGYVPWFGRAIHFHYHVESQP